jgi:hypothetical protein
MVILQFSFSNPDAVPRAIIFRPRETRRGAVERRCSLPGELVIQPTSNCALEQFIGEIEGTGYELVDAFYQQRIDPKDPNGKETYHMVRFSFARREEAGEISPESSQARNNIRAALQGICEAAFWRVRAFLNPFFVGGVPVDGQHALSINLEARLARFQPNGQPIMARPKDATGKVLSSAPVPLKADFRLRVVDNAVQLATV